MYSYYSMNSKKTSSTHISKHNSNHSSNHTSKTNITPSNKNIYHYMKTNIDNHNHNINVDIVKGYNGVMDLDLTYIPEELKESMIEQHYKDILDYKMEQDTLKPNMRYENTIERIRITHEKSQALILKRLKAQEKH